MHNNLYKIANKCITLRDKKLCDCNCSYCRYNVHNNSTNHQLAQTIFQEEYNKIMKEKEDRFIKRVMVVLCLVLFVIYGIFANTEKKHVNITWALERTHDTIRDVNGDGLINCIDYTVRFYEIVPDTEIYRAISEKHDFNHLYVLAYDEEHGGNVFIEPQHFQDENYLIREVWGNRVIDSADIYKEMDWKKFATCIEW